MPKILIINNDLEIGGIQKSLIDFLTYMINVGHEIDLLVWSQDGPHRKSIPESVKIIGIDYPQTWKDISKERNIGRKLSLIQSYVKLKLYSTIIKKPWLIYPEMEEKYDFVISYSQNGFPKFFAIDRVRADKKYLWYHHGSYDFTGEKYDLDQRYFGQFNHVITVSVPNREMLLKFFPKCKVNVIPNIINVNKIISDAQENVSDFQKLDGVVNFVTVSRFSKEKKLDLAIEIADELQKSGLNFRWYFIGDGDTFLEIKQLIKNRNLEEVCILLGCKENPYPYMKLADLYIQTSFIESQSLTIFEALVLNKIIIASNIPAVNDVLQNGQLGLLCDLNKLSFVENIHRILNDQSIRNKIKKNVEHYVVSNDIAHEEIKKLFKI